MNAPLPDTTLPAFLDRRPVMAGNKPLVFSYTIINTYENVCPHQFYRRYVKKDTPFVASKDSDYGNTGHTAMELRLGGKPLPQALERMEPIAASLTQRKAIPEQQLGLTLEGRGTGFFDNNVWYRGKVDAHIVNGETAYIGDFKFGKTIREDPLELELNAVMLHAKYPQLKKIVGQYLWGPDLYGGRTQPVAGPLHDVSDTTHAWGTIRRVAAAITEDARSGEFEKRKSGLCGRCDVLDCEHNGKLARLAREGK